MFITLKHFKYQERKRLTFSFLYEIFLYWKTFYFNLLVTDLNKAMASDEMSTRTQPRETKNNTNTAMLTENEILNNSPKFELYLNQGNVLEKIRCTDCLDIIRGSESSYSIPEGSPDGMKNENSQRPHLMKDLSMFFHEHNVKVLHRMHNRISIEANFSFDFDYYYNLFFNEDMSNFRNKILLKHIYEQLFLRILARKTNSTIDFSKAEFVKFRKSVRETKSGLSTTKVVAAVNVTETEDVNTNLKKNLKQIVDAGEEELVPFTKCVYIYFNCKLPEFQRMVLIRYLKSKIKSLIEYTNKNELFLLRGKNTIFNYLKYVERQIDKEFQKYKNLKVQIIEILGMSGIGKSESISSLAYLLEVLFPYIQSKDLIYSRANDYWWNGYCGQPIVLYDDIAHSTKSRIDFVFELIAVGSSKFENVPMAFIKDMEFTSSLAIITGNFPVVTMTDNVQSSIALRRRLVSEQYQPIVGLGEIDVAGFFKYTMRGQLFNSLEGKETGRSTFSFFKETIENLRNRQIVDFDLSLFTFQNDLTGDLREMVKETQRVCAIIVHDTKRLDRIKETKAVSRILHKGGFIENIKGEKGVSEQKINEIFSANAEDSSHLIFANYSGVKNDIPRTSSVSKSFFVNGLHMDATRRFICVNDEFGNLKECITDFQMLQTLGWGIYDHRCSLTLRTAFFGHKNFGFIFDRPEKFVF